MEEPKHKLLEWIDKRIIGPLIGVIIMAAAGGRIAIIITGAQFNIGIMIAATFLILVIMGISFIMGMFYIMSSFFNIFTKKKLHPALHIASIISMPWLWILEEIFKRKYPPQPLSESAQRLKAKINKGQDDKD